MKFLVLSICLVIFSCSSFNARQVAGYDENNFGNQSIKKGLDQLISLSNHLNQSIPEKGHPKKQLIEKFIADLIINSEKIKQFSAGVNDLNPSWIPSPQHPNRKEIVLALGEIVQSYSVMNQLGIYLTATGVMDGDSIDQENLFNLLAKAVDEVELQISKNILLYQPEDVEAQLQMAKLSYSQFLASVVRGNLSKVISRNNKNLFVRVDRTFKELETLNDSEKAKDFSKSRTWIYVNGNLSGLTTEGSSEIDGFQDDVDLMLKTKFASNMIQVLFESLR